MNATSTRPNPFRTLILLALLTLGSSLSNAQVTYDQLTTGLVAFWPLDSVNSSVGTTPDLVGGRDMNLFGMGASNVVAATRAGGSNCFTFPQTGSGTVIYYNSAGQNPLTGGGDFLPFCNQRGATMSFWIKCNGLTAASDRRFFGEADSTGATANPLYLIGTSSGTPDTSAHWLIRQQDTSGPGGSTSMVDGTYQLPSLGYWWSSPNYTSTNHPLLDNNWHMFTVEIDTNGVTFVYIDGVLDVGSGTMLDPYGNPTIGPPLPVTNYYYTTNIYPVAGVSNPPPRGYVGWVFNGLFNSGATAFGGFKRGGVSGGAICQIDDIAMWNRQLSQAEISFLASTNIVPPPPPPPPPYLSFAADVYETGAGDEVRLSWIAVGATNISISGIGDVTSLGPTASTNVLIQCNTNFILTAWNPINQQRMISLTVFALNGVDQAWHLFQRFDRLFPDTTTGINGRGWTTIYAYWNGNNDRWNVVTVTNSGGVNRVLAPRTGYNPASSGPIAFNSSGGLSFANLNSLGLAPTNANTLFFRFALKEPGPNAGFLSDLDCSIGLTDRPLMSADDVTGSAPGMATNLGPFISIIRNSHGSFNGGPFDLVAQDYGGSSVTNAFSYIASVDPNGLQTNVNYALWMEIQNDNTHAETNSGVSTNTLNEPLYSVWLQKPGDANRTLLFSGFHGNRDYVNYNPIVDYPTPYLSQLFVGVGSETFTNNTPGAYITTNMIAIDDFYLSKSGFSSTFPKTLNLQSVSRNGSNTTITWTSFGSLTPYATNTYTLQRMTSLADPGWTTVATGIPSGGDTTTYVDSPGTDSAFYRIVWP